MKIVLIGRYGTGEILSGPEKVAKNLFNEISLTNKDTVFLSYFFKSEKTRNIKTLLFGFQKLSSNQQVYRLGLLRFALELFKKKPSVVHLITFERFAIIAFLLKPALKYKVIYTVHGIYRYEKTLYNIEPSFISKLKDLTLEKLIFYKSDLIIFLSQQMINLAANFYKVNPLRAMIIPNGVLVYKNYKPKKFNLSNGLKIVFYNGLNDYRKRGLDELLKILSYKNLKNFHLNVIGNLISDISEDISVIKPLPEEQLCGFLSDKHLLIDNLKYMPFSILALEAMALGLIIIASDNSGISSFIENGKNGFVYESKHPEQIAYILDEISEGKYKLEEISKESHLTSRELSWNKIAEQYIKAYKALLA